MQMYDFMSENMEILPEKLQKCVSQIAEKEKLNDYVIESRVIPPDGTSFMGILREITVKGTTENGPKHLDLFVKSIIPSADITIYSVTEVYEKETKMHRDIFVLFNELQNEANIPYDERYITPKSYDGVDTESIIMENLSKKGYTVPDRMKLHSLKFAELSLQQLAKFHSMAFVIQAKRPEYFEAKVKTLQQPFKYDTPEWNSFVSSASQISLSVLDPAIRKKVADYLPTTFIKYSKYALGPQSVKTFVHGDFRASNVMVKMDDNETSEVIAIDFQHSFYGCPIIDFLYFIYTGTDQEFRNQHMYHLRNVYHNSIQKFLKLFGLNVNDYFPRSEFDKMYHESLDYGLMISLWLFPVMLADKEDVPDVTELDLGDLAIKVSDVARSRILDVVEDFMNLGIF